MQQVVMLVEDDEDLRYVVKSSLVKRFGVTVVEAGHGLEALELVGKGLRPDLIIADFRMPNMDGFGLARELQKIGFNRPVIFMTGLNPEQLVKEAFGLGGFDFVRKPLDETFFEAVENALALVKLNWEVKPRRSSVPAGSVESDDVTSPELEKIKAS